MNVAVDITGFDGWLGGIDFVKAYMNALCKIENYNIYVFVQKKTMIRIIKNFVKILLGRYDLRMRKPINDFLKFSKEIIGADIIFYNQNQFEYQLHHESIDIVFPTMRNLGKDFTVPWLPYLFDFQHKYLPDFFTNKEIKYRDKFFEELVTSAKNVIVEANDVVNDVHKFIQNATAQFFVMPYTAIPEKAWFDLSDVDITKYKLPTKYFLISNQFWRHKNHIVGFEALSEVIKSNPDIYIVCTGNTNDYRNPDYFESLLKKIDDLGIKQNVLILGYIPKIEQIKIMVNSIAVIQPTLFEGNPGGGIAYNALALDVPIILSDIPVNKELKYENAVFFDSRDPAMLAEKMFETISKSNSFQRKSIAELVEASKKRQNNLCMVLKNVIDQTIKSYGKDNY